VIDQVGGGGEKGKGIPNGGGVLWTYKTKVGNSKKRAPTRGKNRFMGRRNDDDKMPGEILW